MLFDLSAITFATFLTVILGLGILAQWTAWRFKFPSILLLLAFGFGAKFFFDISIDNYLGVSLAEQLLLPIVGLSVASIPVKRANILSEYVEEELDFTGIGQLLAATHHDEVNSLAPTA